jgi:carbon-monoxide dehydrogenase medium subunit
MTSCDFAYHRPKTLEEACRLGRELDVGALYLAGGTELIPDFRRGAERPRDLISLRMVSELAGIDRSGDGLRIGAMTTVREIVRSRAVREVFPPLVEAALTLGSPQIRAQATIGGNFCRAVPCADTPPICVVGGATLRLVAGDGERVVPAEKFFVGVRRTILRPGEMLADILIPAQPEHSGASYQRFALRRGLALAVASVAARVDLDGDRIASVRVTLGSVAPVPMPVESVAALLEGQRPTEDLFARAGELAAAEARPICDVRGTDVFRRQLVDVLTRRALARATDRARGPRE